MGVLDGGILENEFADRLGRDGHHVLAGSITGLELEGEVDMIALHGGREVEERSVICGGRGNFLKACERWQ